MCYLQFVFLLAIELEKLERRVWHPQWSEVKEEMKTEDLDIPVPSTSPSTLNSAPDYQKKANFLQILGLKSVSRQLRNGKFFF